MERSVKSYAQNGKRFTHIFQYYRIRDFLNEDMNMMKIYIYRKLNIMNILKKYLSCVLYHNIINTKYK